MHILHSPRSKYFFRTLNGPVDFISCLKVIHLDVGDVKCDTDSRVQIFESVEIRRGAMSKLEDEMIGVQLVEKGNQWVPAALLDYLPSIIAKAEMNGFPDLHGIQHAIDC